MTSSAEGFVKIFASIEIPLVTRQSQYLAFGSGNYELYNADVVSTSGKKFSPTDYKNHINEKVTNYSTAKFGSLKDGSTFSVGAIARLSIHGAEKLNPRARKLYQENMPDGISAQKHNPFNNIFAQGVEFMHFLEETIKIIDKILAMKIPATAPKITIPKPAKPTWGIAAIEAPRGTLYHAYEIDTNGKIINADIVTPTVQNLTNLEADAEALLKELELENKAQNVCIRELEMLIRAYDPCITCSVH